MNKSEIQDILKDIQTELKIQNLWYSININTRLKYLALLQYLEEV